MRAISRKPPGRDLEILSTSGATHGAVGRQRSAGACPVLTKHSLAAPLARVLLVDDDLSSRLTLKAILEAGGYFVDSAASAAEAVDKLDERQYELVLSDLQMESPDAGLEVLAHARLMDYKPATALLTTYRTRCTDVGKPVLIEPEDLPDLFGKVADLISQRAARIVARQLREA